MSAFVENGNGSCSVVNVDSMALIGVKRDPKGGISLPFPLMLHELLNSVEADGHADVISWQPHGRAFCIHKKKDFFADIMPKYFRQSTFASFRRQLNLYGFKKLTKGNDKGGYYHELFLRGKIFLANRIPRIKVKGPKVKGVTCPETEPNFYAIPYEVVSTTEDSAATKMLSLPKEQTNTTENSATKLPSLPNEKKTRYDNPVLSRSISPQWENETTPVSCERPKVNDPLQDYLDRKTSDVRCTDEESKEEKLSKDTKIYASTESEMCRTLLWRQEKNLSYSDWTLILVAKDEDSVESVSDGNANGKTDKQGTMFHVHRGILTGWSMYFRSLFGNILHAKLGFCTIELHPNSIQAFPVFLDFLYNPKLGRSAFSRENIVSLRHLAMFFGVDMLLKDTADLIVADIKRNDSREIYQEDASSFHDEKLLEAIIMQNTRQESLLSVAFALFGVLEENPMRYFQEENELLSAWKHILRNVDLHHDAFFVANNAGKYPDICFCGAGLKQVNGVYKLSGTCDNVGDYTNGVCSLFRNSHGWNISFGYFDMESEWISVDLYTCESHSDYPPSEGWVIADEE
mmetsp:Transcript_21677/g.31058  ORF Transcript_21677/g.31058 Transcript_21677/m.31058 type:complete len:574 (-) Transcript_21677:133-1854(-)